MSNLINFFFSFDKLMKEKLVLPLFWLLVIYFGANFLAEFFDMIGLDILEGIIDFLNLFVGFLAVFVGVRLLCELAVAIFRINDNLSPDHGVSETADIDPVAEARRAAEDAARRARLAADSALERTQDVTRRAVDSTKAAATTAAARVEDTVDTVTDKVRGGSDIDPDDEDVLGAKGLAEGDGFPDAATLRPAAPAKAYTVSGEPEVKPAAKPAAKPTTKAAAKPATKTAPAAKADAAADGAPVKRKRGRPKGSKTPVILDPVTGQRLKKDGTPYKKPGPKPKADGTAKTTSATKAKAKSSTAKSSAKTTTGKKRGPGRPKGSKSPAIYDPVTGQRLKKDGTPYKKPGPKPKTPTPDADG